MTEGEGEQEKLEGSCVPEKKEGGGDGEITPEPSESVPFIAVDKTTLTKEIVQNRGWGVDTAVWDWDSSPADPKAKPQGQVNPRQIKAQGKYLQNQKLVENAIANDDDVFDRHQRLKAMGNPKTEQGEKRKKSNPPPRQTEKKKKLEEEREIKNKGEVENKIDEGEKGEGMNEWNMVSSSPISQEGENLEDWEVVSDPGRDHHISLPRVAIYKREDTPLSDDVLSRIKKVFISRGVQEGDLRVVDVTNDYEMQTILLSQSGGRDSSSFPIISICGHTVGGEEALFRLAAQTGAIERHLQTRNYHLGGNQKNLELGNFDKMLGAGESFAAGMGSIISLPFSLLWSAPPQDNTTKAEESVEFKVIHTNWYYRRLHRIFKFDGEKISRLHPDQRDLRASHLYSSVTKVKYQDEVNIVIEYDDGGADYIQARKEDVEQMVSIIQSKTDGVVVDTSLL